MQWVEMRAVHVMAGPVMSVLLMERESPNPGTNIFQVGSPGTNIFQVGSPGTNILQVER